MNAILLENGLISPFVIHHYAAPCYAVPSCLIIPSQTVPYPGVHYAMIRPAVICRSQYFWVCCSGLISAAVTTAAIAAAFAAACKGTLDEFLGPYHDP